MNNIDDIFEAAGSQDLGEFFPFKVVGDRIAGTFIDLLESIDGYHNEQYVVVLMREGVKHRVAVRKTHKVLVDRLRPIKFGQIIGFSFDEERANPGKAASKIINVKQVATMVDDAWLKETVAAAAKFGVSAESALTPKVWATNTAVAAADELVPFEGGPAIYPVAVPVAAVVAAPGAVLVAAVDPTLLATIKTLIVNKGILSDEATDDAIQAKIKEICGEVLTGANGPQIINTIATHVV